MSLRELSLLDPDVVFLNRGSFGACPRPVFERYQEWQRELERQPVEFLLRRPDGLIPNVRASLAAEVGAQPDDLIFVPNATTGLNMVARSMRLAPATRSSRQPTSSGRSISPGTSSAGAAALDMSGGRCRSRCAEKELVKALWSGLTDRTRVLFLSHITSPTALVLPVAELCRRAREGTASRRRASKAQARRPVSKGRRA